MENLPKQTSVCDPKMFCALNTLETQVEYGDIKVRADVVAKFVEQTPQEALEALRQDPGDKDVPELRAPELQNGEGVQVGPRQCSFAAVCRRAVERHLEMGKEQARLDRLSKARKSSSGRYRDMGAQELSLDYPNDPPRHRPYPKY